MSANPARARVISDLRKWEFPAHAAAVIRHAERPPIYSARGVSRVPLTESGVRAAKRFGESMGSYRQVRLYHSPVLRCEQTARAIAEGSCEAGTPVVSIRESAVLGGSYLIDRELALTKADELGSRFIREWFSGALEEGLVKPLDTSLREHIRYIVATVCESTDDRRIDLFVTHDWNIMVLREGLFGIRHEAVGWPEYLDGVSFRWNAGVLRARYRDEIRDVIEVSTVPP